MAAEGQGLRNEVPLSFAWCAGRGGIVGRGRGVDLVDVGSVVSFRAPPLSSVTGCRVSLSERQFDIWKHILSCHSLRIVREKGMEAERQGGQGWRREGMR